jgi:hypothetical protein
MTLFYMQGFPYVSTASRQQPTSSNRYKPHSQIFQLKNEGNHTYQRRHLKLIAYQVHHAFEMRNPYKGYWHFADGGAFKSANVSGGFVDSFPTHVSERLSSAVLAQKHLEADPIFRQMQNEANPFHPANIGWSRLPTFGLSWQAAGHQLSLKDLASDVPFENKLIAAGLDVMGRLAPRARSTGKSMTINRAMLEAHALTTWYASHQSKFSPSGHQLGLLDFLNQRKPVLHPLV